MAEINPSNSAAEETKSKVAAAFSNVEEIKSVATFFKKYQNYIFIGLGLIAVGILGFMFLGKGGDAAKALKYEAALRQAASYAKQDSFDLALNGNGAEFIGLNQIIKKAKGTTTEKMANIEAAMCYLGKNDAKMAIKLLDQAKGFGKQVNARRLSLLGDAKSMLAFADGKKDAKLVSEAVEFYKDAAAEFPSDLVGASYLKRAVVALDNIEKFEDAKKICLTIKEKYAENDKVVADIEKYLGKYGVLN